MATIMSHSKLNAEQVEEKLREFGFTTKCPVSGHSSWTLVDEFVTVVPWSKKRGFVFNNTIPAVMLACNECGYMALFSAVKLGIVDPNEEGADE